MATSTLIGLVIFFFAGGLCTGISVGICLQIEKTKKALEGECKNCKYFSKCLGTEMRMPRTGKCLVHQDIEKEKTVEEKINEEEQSEENKLSELRLKSVELRLNALEKFQKFQEDFTEILADVVQENIEDIDTLFITTEDNDNAIQNISKEIYDGKPRKKSTKKKNTCILCPGNAKTDACFSRHGKSTKKGKSIQ